MQSLIKKARSGQSVYIEEIREDFEAYSQTEIGCLLRLPGGGERREIIALPRAIDDEEQAFVREYFYARVYNIITSFGGAEMQLYAQNPDDFALCGELEEVFQTGMSRALRNGYGKCINVADRINAEEGEAPFAFTVKRGVMPEAGKAAEKKRSRAVSVLCETVSRASHSALCGVDIGYDEVRLVAARNGQVVAVKEYPWNPSAMRHSETMTMPLVLLVRVMRAALNMPLHADAQSHHAYASMMKKDASSAEMSKAASYLEEQYGVERSFDGIGLCFPDVVINDAILGGETRITAGVQAHAKDFEKEFSKLRGLQRALLPFCTHGGAVRLAGSGTMAAYTAAVEQAYSPQAKSLAGGIFVHVLDDENETGWLDESGTPPAIPLQSDALILDLGEADARIYRAGDARSINDPGTGISGLVRSCASGAGIIRLALRYFEKDAPELYRELFDKGLVIEEEKRISVPEDRRAKLITHIVKLAEAREPEAEHVFRTLGEHMGECWKLTDRLLSPRVKERVIYGAPALSKHCFELICAGAAKAKCGARFRAGDDESVYTPLMRELKLDARHSIVNFGRAVGACYYSMTKGK